ncbi:MAG TPA: hypothetical protein VHA75_00945, partial [Rugosimonospora sp.]|nr:hypothetical protein [Rugosimonospora sp.]
MDDGVAAGTVEGGGGAVEPVAPPGDGGMVDAVVGGGGVVDAVVGGGGVPVAAAGDGGVLVAIVLAPGGRTSACATVVGVGEAACCAAVADGDGRGGVAGGVPAGRSG